MGDTVGAVFKGTSAVGAAGPQIPTTGLFGTGGSFNAAQTLSTTSAISTGIGAFSSVAAGNTQAAQFNVQAGSQDLRAEAVGLNATEQSNILRRQLLADIGSATASAGARGIDVGSGSPREVIEQSISNVQSDIGKIKAGGQIASAGERVNASSSRLSGASARASGNLKAVSGLAGFGLSRVV